MLSFAVLSSRGFISVVPLRIPAHGPVSRCLFGTEAPVLSKQAIEIQQNKQNQRALFVRHERLEERVFRKNRPPQSYWPTLACKTKKDDASSECYGVVGHLKHLQCSLLHTSTNAPQYPKWRKSRLKKNCCQLQISALTSFKSLRSFLIDILSAFFPAVFGLFPKK